MADIDWLLLRLAWLSWLSWRVGDLLSRSWHCCRGGNDMWLRLGLAIGADELSSLFSSKSGANERLT